MWNDLDHEIRNLLFVYKDSDILWSDLTMLLSLYLYSFEESCSEILIRTEYPINQKSLFINLFFTIAKSNVAVFMLSLCSRAEYELIYLILSCFVNKS